MVLASSNHPFRIKIICNKKRTHFMPKGAKCVLFRGTTQISFIQRGKKDNKKRHSPHMGRNTYIFRLCHPVSAYKLT